jgi:hypothetical protein
LIKHAFISHFPAFISDLARSQIRQFVLLSQILMVIVLPWSFLDRTIEVSLGGMFLGLSLRFFHRGMKLRNLVQFIFKLFSVLLSCCVRLFNQSIFDLCHTSVFLLFAGITQIFERNRQVWEFKCLAY